jgi:hypothetical protein
MANQASKQDATTKQQAEHTSFWLKLLFSHEDE